MSTPLLSRVTRACRRRCPGCGSGGLFDGWFRLRPACPRCGLLTDRGEHDYFLGAVLLNFVVAETTALAAVVVLLVLTWPTPPWGVLYGLGLGLAVAIPIGFYPLSKMLWLAVDMGIRPPVYRHDTNPEDA